MKTIKFLLHSLSVSDLPHPSHERQYRKIVGRVVDGRTDAPLSIVRVELWDAERLEGPVAVTQTDESGAFQLDLEELFLESQPALLFRLYGEGWTGTLEVSSEALDGRGDELEIAVEPPTRPAEVPAPTPSPDEVPLAALNAENDLGLSDDLLERLHSEGINTLADVRTAGDLAARPGLSKANRVRLRVLAAHADLALISPDIATNARLIGAGFDGVRAIAATPRADFVARIEAAEARAIAATPPAEFVARTEAVLGEARATDLHRTAVAGDMLLHNYAIAARVDGATDRAAPLFPDPWPFPIPWPLPPERCACDDCDATTSPRAYLADLINYALDHLRSSDRARLGDQAARLPPRERGLLRLPAQLRWADTPLPALPPGQWRLPIYHLCGGS